MSAMSDLDVQLQELAERYYTYLEDQLYDPQPRVDGYNKEHQQRHVTELLHSLATAAADLLLNPADVEQFLCPGCGWTMPYVEPHED